MTETCVCGHAPEDHANDPMYKGSTACRECKCIAYEAEENDEGDDDEET